MRLSHRLFYILFMLAVFLLLKSNLPAVAQTLPPAAVSSNDTTLEFTSMKSLVQTDLKIEPLARMGDWIYYLQPCNPHKWQQAELYRAKTNGSHAVKILSGSVGQASNIRFVKDWIYYNKMGNGGLHRIKPDGSEDMQLSERADQYEVRGPYVFYEWVDGLYRVDTDGNNRIRLDGGVNDYYVSSIYRIEGDWIYYQRVTQEQVEARDRSISDFTYGLYRIKMDGSHKTTIIEEKLYGDQGNGYPRPLQVATAGDYIYFASSLSINGDIYAVQKDGSNRHLVCADTEETSPRVTDVFVHNNWIYYKYVYSAEKNLIAVYKVRPNGSEKTLLKTEPSLDVYPDEYQIARALCGNINLDQEWVYYATRHGVYRIKADGSGKSKVFEAGTHDIYWLELRGDYLFFNWVESSSTKDIKVWRCRVKTDGSSFIQLEAP